jgi:hypothetical protein
MAVQSPALQLTLDELLELIWRWRLVVVASVIVFAVLAVQAARVGGEAATQAVFFGQSLLESLREIWPGDTIVVPLDAGRMRPLPLWPLSRRSSTTSTSRWRQRIRSDGLAGATSN